MDRGNRKDLDGNIGVGTTCQSTKDGRKEAANQMKLCAHYVYGVTEIPPLKITWWANGSLFKVL
jgi:hypothetical protein